MQDRIILAIDFGGTKVAIATAHPKRGILKRTEIPSRGMDGDVLLAKSLKAALELVELTHMECNLPLSAIGIGTFGVVREDRIELAPNVKGWENLNLAQHVKDLFGGVPFRIENDVKAAALAELRKGALQGTDFGLYVNFGTGISAGFTAGDQVIRGHNGAAGEIAYLLSGRGEKEGFSSGAAPFEAFAGGAGLSARAAQHFGHSITTKELLGQWNDPDKQAFIQETVREISFQVANLSIAWNPQKVVFGGGMMGAHRLILPTVQEYVECFVPYPPAIVKAHFDRDASLYGAVELAFDLL